jgi:hypothetical protein
MGTYLNVTGTSYDMQKITPVFRLFLFLRSGRFLMTHFGKKQIMAIFLPGSLNAGERIFLANLTVIFSWNGKIMQNT